MSDIIETRKTTIMRDFVIGKKCDVCGKEVPRVGGFGNPVYDYYKITTHHNDWGNDSVDSYVHFDVCSPACAYKLWEEYIHNSVGTRNTMCIEVEHVNEI